MRITWKYTVILALLALLLVPAYAERVSQEVTAQIGFTVEEGPGDICLEAVDEAPLPERTEYTRVDSGSFSISYDEPGNYCYRIWQIPGSRDKVTYDNTVYGIQVTVLTDEEGTLRTYVTASKEGQAHKPDQVIFRNVLEKEPDPPKPPEPPKTGDNSHIGVYAIVMGAALIILIVLSLKQKKRK